MRVSTNVYCYHSAVTGNGKMPASELFPQVTFLSEFCALSGTEWFVCSWNSKCMLYREVQLLSCCTERCSCCHIVQRGAAVVVLYREVQLLLSCCTEKCSCCRVVQRGASVVVLYGEVRLLSCDQGCLTEKENKMISFYFCVLLLYCKFCLSRINYSFCFHFAKYFERKYISIYTYFFFAAFA